MNTVSNNDETSAVSKRKGDTFGDASDESCNVSREHFKEKHHITVLIKEIVDSLRSAENKMKARRLSQEAADILDSYQEDSALLDPHIVDICGPLVSLLTETVLKRDPEQLKDLGLVCSILCVVSKVCGYQSISGSAVFPHHVSYLEPLLIACEGAFTECCPWEVQAVLLLWLSVLLLLPFNFDTVLKGSVQIPAKQRVQIVGKLALQSPALAVAKAGALVIGRVLSRGGGIQNFIVSFGDNCKAGLLEGLNQALKMLPSKLTIESEVEAVFELIENLGSWTSDCTPPAIDPRVGVRIQVLCMRLAARAGNPSHLLAVKIIEHGLGSKEYVVRWAAAKGAGRLFGTASSVSIPIIRKVDNCMSCEFHGICLASAELITRGYPLDPRVALELALPALEAAGIGGVASWQFRDGGCYILWALARSIPSANLLDQVLMPSISALLTVCLFDREINCRRAAAAALQELIGRVGTVRFPVGLQLLQVIDFWAVAKREDCFVKFPAEVLEIFKANDQLDGIVISESLRTNFVNHLAAYKLVHQDREMRILAAQALTVLLKPETGVSNDFFLSQVCAAVQPESPLLVRHGALQFLKEAVSNWTSQSFWTEDTQSQIRNVLPRLEKERLYRGKGGEAIRIVCLELVESLCVADWIGFKPATGERFFQTIYDGLRHLTNSVQVAAGRALVALSKYREISMSLVINKLLAVVKDPNENVASRRGAVLGLACWSKDGTFENTEHLKILKSEALAWPSHPSGNSEFVDAETRKFALLGVLRLAHMFPKSLLIEALTLCVKCAEDFGTDRRGDVGSWVRALAYDGLASLLSKGDGLGDGVFEKQSESESVMAEAVRVLVGGCGERLDRMRGLAALRLHSLIKGQKLEWEDLEATAFGLPNHKQSDSSCSVLPLFGFLSFETLTILQKYFFDPPKDRPELSTALGAWSTSPCVFTRIVGLTRNTFLRAVVVRGLCSLVGGVTAETVGQAARTAIIDFVKDSSIDDKNASILLNAMIDYFLESGEPIRCASRTERNNRFVTPAMVTLGFVLDLVGECPSLEKVVNKVASEIRGSTDPNKLRAAAGLLVAVWRRNFQVHDKILPLLAHHLLNSELPAIRHYTAESIYALLVNEDGSEEVADLIAGTDWVIGSGWVSSYEKICCSWGIGLPEQIIKEKIRREKPKISEYAQLVKEEHW